VSKILGSNQNIGREKGSISDEIIRFPQLLGARARAALKSTPMCLYIYFLETMGQGKCDIIFIQLSYITIHKET